MKSKRELLAAALVAVLLVVVPSAQALTFSSTYGEYSLSSVSFANGIPVCCTQNENPPKAAGDGLSGAVSSSVSGSDTTGDSASASLTINDQTHTISGSASEVCSSSTVCFDNSGGYHGVGGSAAGDMYDTFSASCSGTCLGPDVTLVWTVTGYFNTAENGMCAQQGCPPGSYSAVGDESSIAGLITLHAPGYNPIELCYFEGNKDGCMNEIVNYLQGWNYCQGGGDPLYYCPYGTASQAGQTFVDTGTVDLTSLIESSSCGFACDLSATHPLTLEFENSIDAFTNVPLSEGVTLTSSTFQVFTTTPGWTITSAACGCSVTAPKSSTTTAVSATPNPVGASQATTLTATISGSTPTGTVSFSTSSPTGTFTPSSGQCTLSSGSCSVSYTDVNAGSPTITATYGGDSSNLGSSGSYVLTVTSPVVSASLGETLGVAEAQSSSIGQTVATSLADTVAISDGALSSLEQTITTKLTEEVGVADSMGSSVGHIVTVALSDTVGFLDNLVNSIFFPVTVSTISIVGHSPVNVLVTDPTGDQIGCTATGTVVNQIPGGTLSGCNSEPETITIPNPPLGTYKIQLSGNSGASPSGSPFTLTITSFDKGGKTLGTSSSSGTATPSYTNTLYFTLLAGGGISGLSPILLGVAEFALPSLLVAAVAFLLMALVTTFRARFASGKTSRPYPRSKPS